MGLPPTDLVQVMRCESWATTPPSRLWAAHLALPRLVS